MTAANPRPLRGKPWVIAHLHHIGVRLIATVVRGDDDETRPEKLLHSGLSWASFILFQAAICIAGYSLMSHSAGLGVAAIAGLSGWAVMTTNMIHSMLLAVRPIDRVIVRP